MKDGKLMLTVPGQPQYQLENIGGRRYKLQSAPAGFFVTFRPVKDKETETEMFLEQPQGNFVLARIKTDAAHTTRSAINSAAATLQRPAQRFARDLRDERRPGQSR